MASSSGMGPGGPSRAPSYGVVLVKRDDATSHSEVVAALAAARFSGWVSPDVSVGSPASTWVVAVPEAPLGHVAARRATLHELAASLSRALSSPTVGIIDQREELLTLSGHVAGETWVDYVSDAHRARPQDEFAWGPEGAHGAGALARLAGRADAEKAAYELLSDDPSEDVSESERILALARLLAWPTWIVSVTGLPKRVLHGPEPRDFTRLRAGSTGIGGRVAGRLARIGRRADLTED